ncbi:MAG: phosphoribosylanthranilate isomerase [Desulfotomaculales bacterium]
MTWVKICGIQDVETALWAVRSGADALGFVFAPSRRRVTPDQVRQIAAVLPASTVKVGVFVNEPVEEVRRITRFCRLDAVQLHGAESPEYCRRLNLPIIKAFRVREENDLAEIDGYDVAAVLLDAYIPGKEGGTGECFNWFLARKLPLSCRRKVILAGGLNSQNVQAAIRIARPYGVDVSSGVETGGQKDREKIRAFLEMAKRKGVQK